jgi:3D (Asp-Asp-Asp) domain-containing protein
MKTFREYITERYTFGATAYGNADIDKTTAAEINKGILKPEWQFLGNKNNRLTPGYSVASNVLPHGTIVKITDRRTGQPVGAKFGNTNGIFKVEDTGGKNVTQNIDFYSGSNKQMMDYFAAYGKNTNNLSVEVTNIRPGSPEEQELLANLNKAQPSTLYTTPSLTPDFSTPMDAAAGLARGAQMLSKGVGI